MNRQNESSTEGAFQSKHKQKTFCSKGKKKVARDKSTYLKKGSLSLKELESKGKFPSCGICKRTSHLEKDCWYKKKPQMQCHLCKKFGHVEKFCRLKQGHSFPNSKPN